VNETLGAELLQTISDLSLRRLRQLIAALHERRDLGVALGPVAQRQNDRGCVVEEMHPVAPFVVDDETISDFDHFDVARL